MKKFLEAVWDYFHRIWCRPQKWNKFVLEAGPGEIEVVECARHLDGSICWRPDQNFSVLRRSHAELEEIRARERAELRIEYDVIALGDD